MMEHYVTNTDSFKLKVVIKDCLHPKDKKCVEFVREQYNSFELVDCSTYQFFLSNDELVYLGKILMETK